MTRDEAVARAVGAVGHRCNYRLGAGGEDPRGTFPWRDVAIGCDCSGFIAWVLGVGRKVDLPDYERWNGGWFETSAIYRDALSPYGFFRVRADGEAVEAGDILVWPDAHGTQGHIGIITGIVASQDGAVREYTVTHCSRGNHRRTGDAIQSTGDGVFVNHRAIAAVWRGFEQEDEA